MASPETSVIIRTFNEEKHLPGLLEALQEQTYRDFEIVVVDSGSLDRTRDIAAQFTDKLLRINSHDFTFGYSLNVGIQAASGKYASIVSAHTLPTDTEWLGTLVEPLRDARTAMSYGRQLGWTSSRLSEVRDLDRTFGSRPKVLRPPHYFAHNANSAIQKELWDQRPFDESLPGLEDIDWAKYWMQRGYQVVYDPEAALYHIHEEHWRQIRRRYHREAIAARYIGIKGKQHILAEAVSEVGKTLLDLGYGMWSSRSSVVAPKQPFERAREVLLFRANKALGTISGLMDGASAQDAESRERLLFDKTCRAVVVHGPGRVSLDEVNLPEVKPGDVMVRVAYNGICGRDLEILRGTTGDSPAGATRYPVVLGHEISGHIVTVGTNVSHLQEGDTVVLESTLSCDRCTQCLRSNRMACAELTELGATPGVNGGYAEYVVIPGRFVHQVPPGLDLRKAALCEPLAIILKGLNRLARVWPGQSEAKSCAVVGAGSLGHLCARVLALKGHQVTVFDQDPLRRSYFQGSNVDVSDDIGRLGEFEVLVEVTGDPDVLDVILNESATGATILLLGLPYSYKAFTFERIVTHDKTVVGSVGSSSSEFQEALKILTELDLDHYLQCILPLEQYQEGWENFRQRKHLKVLLKVDQDLP